MKTALILPGSGAGSIIQAGMLLAAFDTGLRPDAVYCASGGSLNAMMWCQPNPVGMERLWMTVRNKDVYRSNVVTWSRIFGKTAALYDSRPLYNLIQKCWKPLECGYPVYCQTVDVDAQETLTQDLRTAVEPCKLLWASASPPVFFPTVEWQSRRLTDGGLFSNYALSQAVNDGYDRLVILLGRRSESPQFKSILDSLGWAIGAPISHYLKKEMKFIQILNGVEGYKEIEVILVQPETHVEIPILDFDGLGDRKAWLNKGYQLYMKASVPPVVQ